MAPKDSEGGVWVTTQDISREVTGMRDDLKEAVTILRENVKDVADHESRIRKLEKWKYALPASLFLALVGVGEQILHLGK